MTTTYITIIISIIFLADVFGTFIFYDKVRKNRIMYRLLYVIAAITGMLSSYLLCSNEDFSGKPVFIIYSTIVGLISLIHNLRFLIGGEGDILTSTLHHCSVNVIRSGKQRQRISYRVDGTSYEGNKNSFLLRYPEDQRPIDIGPITDSTIIIVRYYSKSRSICSVTRQEGLQNVI